MLTQLVRFRRRGGSRWGRAVSLRAHVGERGATAVEYALMVGLIAVVIVGAVTLFGLGVNGLFTIPAGVFGGP